MSVSFGDDATNRADGNRVLESKVQRASIICAVAFLSICGSHEVRSQSECDHLKAQMDQFARQSRGDLDFIRQLQQMQIRLRECQFRGGPSFEKVMREKPVTPQQNALIRAFEWIGQKTQTGRQNLGSGSLSTEVRSQANIPKPPPGYSSPFPNPAAGNNQAPPLPPGYNPFTRRPINESGQGQTTTPAPGSNPATIRPKDVSPPSTRTPQTCGPGMRLSTRGEFSYCELDPLANPIR